MRAHPHPLVESVEPALREDTPELLPCDGCGKPTCYGLVACVGPDRMELRKFQPDHTGGLGAFNLKRAGRTCGPWIAQDVRIGGAFALHICAKPFDDRARAIAAGAHDWSDREGRE